MSVPLFRLRETQVEAVFFDGSPACALEVISWAERVASHVVIRERIEYGGWADREGHLELEIQGNELQATASDWVVCTEASGQRRLDVETDESFRRRFEPVD